MAILESVKELASKLGAETNGRDITDQLNKINKHLDEAALSGRDIAEAVRTYSKNASGGGGGGETFEVEMTLTRVDSSATIVISKTLQETIDAIEAGKQIDFSVTFDGREGTVICYGVWDMQLGTGDNIAMLVYDGTGLIIAFYWVDDGNLVGADRGTIYLVGGTS